MVTQIHIDFETYSEADLSECGAWIYSAHPSTHVYCMAYALDNNPVDIVTDFSTIPEDLKKALTGDYHIWAHNMSFELSIWENQLRKRGWPIIPLRRWRDTMYLCGRHGVPRSLKHAGTLLDLTHKKDESGRTVMLKCAKTKNSDPETLAKLYSYCKDDVLCERELGEVLDIPNDTFEERMVLYDTQSNLRGISIDTVLAKKAVEAFNQIEKEAQDELVKLTDGKVATVNELKAITAWLLENGVSAEKLDKNAVVEILYENVPPKVRRVLEIRQLLGNAAVKKFKNVFERVDPAGVIRHNVSYSAASTGRWGGNGFQIHNLKRPKMKQRDIENAIHFLKNVSYPSLKFLYPQLPSTLGDLTRSLIVPKKGYKLICADYSNIETRVLAWIAGEEKILDSYRNKRDLYVEMASVVYNNPNLTKKDEQERQLGKKAILGAGYGMGWPKFKRTVEQDGMKISGRLAFKTINAYRNTYTEIPKLWYAIEEAVVKVLRGQESVTVGQLRFHRDKKFLMITLPSGRTLYYYKPKIETVTKELLKYVFTGEDSYTIEKSSKECDVISFYTKDASKILFLYEDLYGGKLVENIVQAVARDILAEAWIRAEDKGYRITMTVHDELVAEVPDEKDFSLEEFVKIICVLPTWATGCPIEAEGWEGYRYRK